MGGRSQCPSAHLTECSLAGASAGLQIGSSKPIHKGANLFTTLSVLLCLFQAGVTPEPLQAGWNTPQSTDYGGSLLPEGGSLYFTHITDAGARVIHSARREAGGWAESRPLRIDHRLLPGSDVQISPDGRHLIYKTRQNHGVLEGRADGNIYISDRTETGWTWPVALPPTVNSRLDEFYPVMTANGSLYFSRQDHEGNYDLFVSRFERGQFQEAEPLPDRINTPALESDAFISPDESYMIFVRMGHDNAIGQSDLFIAFRNYEGWTEPVMLPEPLNSSGLDGSPFFSERNGRLYFTSNRRDPNSRDGALDIYTVAFEPDDWR